MTFPFISARRLAVTQGSGARRKQLRVDSYLLSPVRGVPVRSLLDEQSVSTEPKERGNRQRVSSVRRCDGPRRQLHRAGERGGLDDLARHTVALRDDADELLPQIGQSLHEHLESPGDHVLVGRATLAEGAPRNEGVREQSEKTVQVVIRPGAPVASYRLFGRHGCSPRISRIDQGPEANGAPTPAQRTTALAKAGTVSSAPPCRDTHGAARSSPAR